MVLKFTQEIKGKEYSAYYEGLTSIEQEDKRPKWFI